MIGSMVVSSFSAVPVDGNMEREVAYWVMKTEDSGRNWKITKTIATDELDTFAVEEEVPKFSGIKSSPSWSVRRDKDTFTILHTNPEGKQETVLSIPRTPYKDKSIRDNKE